MGTGTGASNGGRTWDPRRTVWAGDGRGRWLGRALGLSISRPAVFGSLEAGAQGHADPLSQPPCWQTLVSGASAHFLVALTPELGLLCPVPGFKFLAGHGSVTWAQSGHFQVH